LADPKEINRMQHLAVEKSRLHVPLLFGLDVIHGYRTIFPAPLGMASSWDPAVEEQAQALAATEAKSAGIRWTFTPMVDIARDARWGRIQEGVGSLMSAYMDLNDVPASGNRWLLTDVLRTDWGFRGFVASDANAVASLQTHGYASDPSDATYKAITAGAGMDMASQTYVKNLPQLVASGRVSQA